jgi:hypothetical protein
MNTNYVRDRVDDILRQKIAMGGENKRHRYRDVGCKKYSKQGKYWAKYTRGKKSCIPYEEHLEMEMPVVKRRVLRGKNKFSVGPKTKKCKAKCRREYPYGRTRNACGARCHLINRGGCDCCPMGEGVLINSARTGGVLVNSARYNGGIGPSVRSKRAAARNPWLIFLKRYRQKYAKELDGMPQAQVAQLASDEYHNM